VTRSLILAANPAYRPTRESGGGNWASSDQPLFSWVHEGVEAFEGAGRAREKSADVPRPAATHHYRPKLDGQPEEIGW